MRGFTKRKGSAKEFASGFEEDVAKQLTTLGVPFKYPGQGSPGIEFNLPDRTASFTPNFVLKNGIVIHTFSRFVTADRRKIRLVQDQYPGLDIRLVFVNSAWRITKDSQTTYAMWCERFGFKYVDQSSRKDAPVGPWLKAWVAEPANMRSLAEIAKFTKRVKPTPFAKKTGLA